MPRGGTNVGDAYALALGELIANIAAGERFHPCDVHFGADVTIVLADAEKQVAARRLRLTRLLPQVDSRIGREAVNGH